MQNTQQSQLFETPKFHPRVTPTPSMEALSIIEMIDKILTDMPKVSIGGAGPHALSVTPRLADWLEKGDGKFPEMEKIAIMNVSRCMMCSVSTVIEMLESGVPPVVALGALPEEFSQLLSQKQASLKLGGTD